jgi:hypothetical protein
MHVANYMNRAAFFRTNYSLFLAFWRAFFTKYLDLKGKPLNKVFEPLLKYQYGISKRTKITPFTFRVPTFSWQDMYEPVFQALWDGKYVGVEWEESQRLYEELIEYADNYYVRRGSERQLTVEINKASIAAYMRIAKQKPPTFGQELEGYSEIMCILSELAPNHPNVIKTLKLIK